MRGHCHGRSGFHVQKVGHTERARGVWSIRALAGPAATACSPHRPCTARWQGGPASLSGLIESIGSRRERSDLGGGGERRVGSGLQYRDGRVGEHY